MKDIDFTDLTKCVLLPSPSKPQTRHSKATATEEKPAMSQFKTPKQVKKNLQIDNPITKICSKPITEKVVKVKAKKNEQSKNSDSNEISFIDCSDFEDSPEGSQKKSSTNSDKDLLQKKRNREVDFNSKSPNEGSCQLGVGAALIRFKGNIIYCFENCRKREIDCL